MEQQQQLDWQVQGLYACSVESIICFYQPTASMFAVGSRGPILLEDYHLVEKLAQVRMVPLIRSSDRQCSPSLQMLSHTTFPIFCSHFSLHLVFLQFDRERIPERVVHARGAVAKGFFEVSIKDDLCHRLFLCLCPEKIKEDLSMRCVTSGPFNGWQVGWTCYWGV